MCSCHNALYHQRYKATGTRNHGLKQRAISLINLIISGTFHSNEKVSNTEGEAMRQKLQGVLLILYS